MCDTKFRFLFVLLLFVEVQLSNGMPQGFFSQGFSVPRYVSSLPSIKIESPIKSSLFNVFGKQNSGNKIENLKQVQHPAYVDKTGKPTEELKPDQNLLGNVVNGPQITTQDKNVGENNVAVQDIKLPSVAKKDTEIISKFNTVEENYSDSKDIDITTELSFETTTDEYETTTIEAELLNRSSPQLVASLLG